MNFAGYQYIEELHPGLSLRHRRCIHIIDRQKADGSLRVCGYWAKALLKKRSW